MDDGNFCIACIHHKSNANDCPCVHDISTEPGAGVRVDFDSDYLVMDCEAFDARI